MTDMKKITAQSYDDTVDEYVVRVDNLHPFNESKKFLDYIPLGGDILDLGCGYGRDSKIFSKQGYKVVGIDISQGMIAKAKDSGINAIFHVMDMCTLMCNDASFDGVWASASVLHIPKKELSKVLSHIYRVLKPGGIFYCSCKSGEGELLEEDARYGGVKKFWSYFNPEEIQKYIITGGFDVVDAYLSKSSNTYATHQRIHVFSMK